jgi:small-conductance mechanosensitive channel
MLAVTFYDVVLFVHVTAIVAAFGVIFAYPILIPYVQRNHPRSVPALHEAQGRVDRFLVTPGATVALLAGVYLATDRDLWSEVWVTVPATILVVLLGLGGAFFAPQDRRAAELAARDVATAGDGDVVWSAEYEAVSRRVAAVGAAAAVLVVIAIYFMTAKPFA